jgi:hypothetical protein
MSTDHFFQLSGAVTRFDLNAFETALSTSKHVFNVLYEPNDLQDKKIEGTTFENVSFSKTAISGVNFKDCVFIGCMFIGTKFDRVAFHGCSFRSCNFYKSGFKRVYAKPEQFEQATPKDSYANIGVHLYQELRNNYVDEAQSEFQREAEYQFKKWSQKLIWGELRKEFRWKRLGSWSSLAAYKISFGYGLRLRNLAATTCVSIGLLTVVAKYYSGGMFEESGPVTWVKGLYFTVSTMITLGAVGFTPRTESGYLFLLLNAIVGLVLLSATLNAFAKRVSR